MKTNPNFVSRTLDPSKKSLLGVLGRHDYPITDADINLVQDLQDYKRAKLLENKTSSGALGFKPFEFNQNLSCLFKIPAFDVLFNGEVVTIGGNLSADLSTNVVRIPSPPSWTQDSKDEQAYIYVAFLELWYQALNAETGAGYYVPSDNPNVRFFYPYGCVTPYLDRGTTQRPGNLIPNDSIDPFQGIETTERSQVQWAIRVQRVALDYDFKAKQFGLEPMFDNNGALLTKKDVDGKLLAYNAVFAGAANVDNNGIPAPIVGDADYTFTHMARINGDSGLWRAGKVTNDDIYTSELGTMDGYSYAMPLAVIFQYNSGNFDLTNNPFGCGDSNVGSTTGVNGMLSSKVSGRYDKKLADSIWPDDVVDTRLTVDLNGKDYEHLVEEGFVDLITGTTRQALAKDGGVAIGSTLPYNVAVGPELVQNADHIGPFDGYMNGFSSDDRVFFTTKAITVEDKSTSTKGMPWGKDDAFTINLPSDSPATISYCNVQALVNDTTNGTKTPVLLLQGQIAVDGLGTKSIRVRFLYDLAGTAYDPGLNPLYVTLGVDYPANSDHGNAMDLVKVPLQVYGGTLYDARSTKTLPVYGISEYSVSADQQVLTLQGLTAYNPYYSNLKFGTRAKLVLSSATPGIRVTQTKTASGDTSTNISFPRSLERDLTGLYVVSVNRANGDAVPVASRMFQTSGNDYTIGFTVQGAYDLTQTTLTVTVLCADTAQLAYNAPVKGVTSIEETVLFGTVTQQPFKMDDRIQVVSGPKKINGKWIIVFGATDCMLKGIAGDDNGRLIFVRNQSGTLTDMRISDVVFSNGLITVTLPDEADLANAANSFFMVGAINPAFSPDSKLVITQRYIPYQGEGIEARDYEVIFAEDRALVTTNGTGAAPVIGLKDVYPYNRELPIVSALPARATWEDALLKNQALAAFSDNNYEAKRYDNVEHTFEVPLHTNDFIQPISKGKRKKLQLHSNAGGRGFEKVTPHVGFAIRRPTPRTVLGENLLSTIAPITMYVSNHTGDDNNDGLTTKTPKGSIQGAYDALPPVIRHAVSIQLMDTGTPYSLATQRLETIALGDGDVRKTKYYALANIAARIQEGGRIVITRQSGATGKVTIDCAGVSAGDGPTSAFFVDNTRVLFNGLRFTGFADVAIKGIASDIEIVDCDFEDNVQAGGFEQGCGVTMVRGSITLGSAGKGMVLSGSALEASGTVLTVKAGASVGPFFVVERGSNLILESHDADLESNVQAGTVIAQVRINSSVTCEPNFVSQGKALLQMNSVLSRTVKVNPFAGMTSSDIDASSTVVTDLQ